MVSIAKPINKVLERHKVEWHQYCKKVTDKQLKLKWIQMKRSEYLIHDETVSMYESIDSFFGMGCDLRTRPHVVFLVKSPRSKDKSNGFSDGTWAPLIDRITKGEELKTSDGLRRNQYFCLYYFPRRLFVKKYKPIRRRRRRGGEGEVDDDDDEDDDEDDAPELTSKHIDVYGWYVTQILKLLNPRVIVPIGSYITRATLQGFHSERNSSSGGGGGGGGLMAKDLFGAVVKIRGLWLTNAEKAKYDNEVNIPSISIIPLIDPCQTSLVSFCDGDKDDLWNLCWNVICKSIAAAGGGGGGGENKRSRKVSEKSLIRAVKEMEPVKKSKLTDRPCAAERYTFGGRVSQSDQKARNITGPMDSFFKKK